MKIEFVLKASVSASSGTACVTSSSCLRSSSSASSLSSNDGSTSVVSYLDNTSRCDSSRSPSLSESEISCMSRMSCFFEETLSPDEDDVDDDLGSGSLGSPRIGCEFSSVLLLNVKRSRLAAPSNASICLTTCDASYEHYWVFFTF